MPSILKDVLTTADKSGTNVVKGGGVGPEIVPSTGTGQKPEQGTKCPDEPKDEEPEPSGTNEEGPQDCDGETETNEADENDTDEEETEDSDEKPGTDGESCCQSPQLNLKAFGKLSGVLSESLKLSTSACKELKECQSNSIDKDGLLHQLQDLINKILESLNERFNLGVFNVLKKPIVNLVQRILNIILNAVECLLCGKKTTGNSDQACRGCGKLSRLLGVANQATKDLDKSNGIFANEIDVGFTTNCKVGTKKKQINL